MHGIVLKGLKDFVVETYGLDAWRAVQEEASVPRRLYVPVTEYPDAEAMALVEAACEVTGQEAADVMEAFGRFVVPQLASTYGVHVDPEWSSVDLLANVETSVHEALRNKEITTFTPPEIGAERLGPDTVVVTYSSSRQLCPLARGILHGIAGHFDERFDVEERQCSREGADHCEFLVERVGAAEAEGADTAAEAESTPTEGHPPQHHD